MQVGKLVLGDISLTTANLKFYAVKERARKPNRWSLEAAGFSCDRDL
jgi:hypothetical protein